MKTKCFEIRDRMTFIPVVAIQPVPANEGQRYLIRRAGYGLKGDTFIVVRLTDCQANNDAYDWTGSGRTMQAAHRYIDEHFEELEDGAVIDVEHILGETTEPTRSEREGML
ncbi:MAG TPA: hypothetical protein VIM73_02390 [Polyangiaceae bacterium]